MQDEKRSIQENSEHVVSPSLRTQRIMEYLEDLWKYPHAPSHNDLRRITEFVVNLPEAYRSIALTTIANHFVNSMGLHILDLMAMFQQKAEQEEVSIKERERTFEDILPDAFKALDVLNKQVSVQSLDSLAALSNFTMALYTLSRADSSEEAQTWLYELPKSYQSELMSENLLVNSQDQEGEATSSSNWLSYQPKQGQGYIIGTDTVQATELPWIVPSPELLPISFEKPAA